MKIRLIKFKRVKSTNGIALRLIKKKKILQKIVVSKKKNKEKEKKEKKWE